MSRTWPSTPLNRVVNRPSGNLQVLGRHRAEGLCQEIAMIQKRVSYQLAQPALIQTSPLPRATRSPW